MIITDGVHLASDWSVAELHEFATKIGLKREWFQNHRIPHYDLTTKRKARQAIEAGAWEMSTKQLVGCAVKRGEQHTPLPSDLRVPFIDGFKA